VHAYGDLPQAICAVGAARRFARSLYSRQEQSSHRSDDGDDDKQLDQRKTV
jgi:hypothetical protein